MNELKNKYKIDWSGIKTIKDGKSASYEHLVQEQYPNVDWYFDGYERTDYERGHTGDFYMLGKKDGEHYFFMMSYGSCSGCDWLERIKTFEELKELMDEIHNKVIVKSEDEMCEFLKKVDWLDGKLLEYDDRVEKHLKEAFEKRVSSLPSSG